MTWRNQFKFLVFGNIKRVFRRFAFTVSKLLTFIFKIKKDFNKNWYFMCQMVTSDSQNARPIPPTCVNLTQTLGRFNMWVTSKTNRPIFCLLAIMLKLSHALDSLFSVLSRLHDCRHKCTFYRMKHHWTWCDYFQILLFGILSSMEPTIYFQI